MMRPIWLALTLASSTAFAVNNNDWPKVGADCNAVFHPPLPLLRPSWSIASSPA
jgi:hypothetical protein